MQTLAGKVAWVTGAGTGIGEAAAVALAKAGMTVVLTGRRASMLEAVADRINAAGPGKAQVCAADLTKSNAVEAVAQHLKGQLGRLDVVVNNAGANPH
jgi:NADP-dependent 3-hydroxy acid dehydrogenase YdfG